MSAKDDVRKGFLGSLMPKTGKVERPAPQEADSLGNRKVKDTASITIWLNPAAIKAFKLLAREEDKTIQELTAEAMNLVFRKYHKGEIA